ncbi:MAG TPA: hypothetical protein VME43_33685 [Bryobacteraceae bacterium]|nr:hypothetical protein [Bryobacteraceae bacterium]
MAGIRSLGVLLVLVVAASAQPARSVDDLVSFIKSAIANHYPDKQVAQEVARIRLNSRLDDATVTELQHEGALPRTVEALRQLAKTTASLPAAPIKIQTTVGPPPAPSQEDQANILEEIRQHALDYSSHLPNYICLQQTKRHIDPTGNGNWQLSDRVVERLTYYEQKENYKVVTINDAPVTTEIPHDKLPGAKSSGEFGSILREIFQPDTQTEFQWERWTRLGPRVMYVFAYRIRQQRYGIRDDESKQEIHVGYHGLVYADRDSKNVMRLTLICDDIPPDFPIHDVSLRLDYDFTDISGQQFLLPYHSELHSREGRFGVWNETDFRAYNKYSADATISFGGDADAANDDKLKEQPITGTKPPAKKQ